MAEPLRQRMKPVKDKAYCKDYIAKLPCLYCGKTPVQVCHVRLGEACEFCEGSGEFVYWNDQEESQIHECEPCEKTGYRYGKLPATRHDRFVWPGCPECHLNGPEAQHSANEARWHTHRGVDILRVSKALSDAYDQSKSMPEALEMGAEIVIEIRNATR